MGDEKKTSKEQSIEKIEAVFEAVRDNPKVVEERARNFAASEAGGKEGTPAGTLYTKKEIEARDAAQEVYNKVLSDTLKETIDRHGLSDQEKALAEKLFYDPSAKAELHKHEGSELPTYETLREAATENFIKTYVLEEYLEHARRTTEPGTMPDIAPNSSEATNEKLLRDAKEWYYHLPPNERSNLNHNKDPFDRQNEKDTSASTIELQEDDLIAGLDNVSPPSTADITQAAEKGRDGIA